MLSSATHFSATVTSGTAVTYAWAFGDGAAGSGATPQHTYAAIGAYTAVVTATNPIDVAIAQTIVSVVAAPSPRAYLPLVDGDGE